MPKKNASDAYFPPGEAQGQLARPAFFMQDSERYPRGFNPGRQREVNDAMVGVQMRGPMEEQAKFRETVARSTVPTENLRHLREVRVDDGNITGDNDGHIASWTLHPDVFGSEARSEGGEVEVGLHPTIRMLEGMAVRPWLRHPGGGVHVSAHDEPQSTYRDTPIEKAPGALLRPPQYEDRAEVNREMRLRAQQSGYAAIHEIGHHVQNLRLMDKAARAAQRGRPGPDVTSVMFPKSTKRAAGEAEAENYAAEHFVPDRRLSSRHPEDRLWDEIDTGHSGYDSHYFDTAKEREAYWNARNVNPNQFINSAAGIWYHARNHFGEGTPELDDYVKKTSLEYDLNDNPNPRARAAFGYSARTIDKRSRQRGMDPGDYIETLRRKNSRKKPQTGEQLELF